MDPKSFVEWLDNVGDRISFDVDKAWHAIHLTLTGDAWEQSGPFGAVVFGGEPFGEDIGYGPARWLHADAVAEAARALAALSPGELSKRLDFARMVELDIYPSIWGEDPEAELLVEYVVDGFTKVRDRFAQAADRSHGFVISLL